MNVTPRIFRYGEFIKDELEYPDLTSLKIILLITKI